MKRQIQYSVKTFGCKVNTYDSALIQKNLTEAGMFPQQNLKDTSSISGNTGDSMELSQQCSGDTTKSHTGGDDVSNIHIVNTCAVTAEAVQEAKRWIRRYRKQHPDSHTHIVVTGCAAQVETDMFSSLSEVDMVVANSHKSHLANIINTNIDPSKKNKSHQKVPVFKSSIFQKSDLGKGGGVESSHTRLFLKIQDGCDSFCTFCVIPFARGKSRSIDPQSLIRAVQEHYHQGVREVVLTGVHIGDYQIPHQKKEGLATLVRMLLKNTDIPRLRLSSLEPIELTEELLDLYSDDRMCAHFHLSIQSVHSEILKNMKRKYTAYDVEQCLIKIHQKMPHAFVGMDVIAGFPGETQEQFEDIYSRLNSYPWTKMHVFPYSPRRYTYAHRMYSSWPRSMILKRAALMRHLSESRFQTEIKKQIGTIKKVLPLSVKTNQNHGIKDYGLSRDYWTVQWQETPHLTEKSISATAQSLHEEVAVHIHSIDHENHRLIGCIK